MIGYCAEILLLQNEHFPLRKIQENRGMLWYHLSGCLHVGQCDAGIEILSPFGSRMMTTFKNEPMHNPMIANIKSSIKVLQIFLLLKYILR